MFKNGQSRDKQMWECYIIYIFELQPQIVHFCSLNHAAGAWHSEIIFNTGKLTL